jgi:hypothetical protein
MDKTTFVATLGFLGGLLLTLPAAHAGWDDVEDGAESIGSAIEKQWEKFEDWVSPETEEERREEAQERREDAQEEAEERARGAK